MWPRARRCKTARSVNDQRNAQCRLKKRLFQPQPAFAQHLAMIGAKYDDRVVLKAGLMEGVKQARDAFVNITDGAIVGPPRAHDRLMADVCVGKSVLAQDPEAMWIGCFLRNDQMRGSGTGRVS